MVSRKEPNPSALKPRKAPKQQRATKTVEAIVEAGAHILEQGVHPFTTNHIAERAGVSIGSLYQYFPGANSIMAALIEKHVADERAAAEAVLSHADNAKTDLLRELLHAFVKAHADAPRLTARLHALAAGFDLQQHLAAARDAQAASIAAVTGWPEADVLISVMAVEGVVLATLASRPEQLKSSVFMDRLYAIARAPFKTAIRPE